MSVRDLDDLLWFDACALIDRAERLHRAYFVPCRSSDHIATWQPPIDMYESDHEILIIVALPGVAAEDLEIEFESGTLAIVGQRQLPRHVRPGTLRRLEIPHGRFERRIALGGRPLRLGRSDHADGCVAISLIKGIDGSGEFA